MANTKLSLKKYPCTFLVDNEKNLDATSSRYDYSSFFTCEICVELVPLNKKFKNTNRCFHNYCEHCIAKYIQVKVIQDNTSQIQCPHTNCNVVLDTVSCRSILSETVFEKWCRVNCESAVLLESSKGGFAYGRSYCPYRDCSELVLNECQTSRSSKITRSNCPSCKRLFCFHCMVPWKEYHRCTDRSPETVTDIDSNDVLFMENAKNNKWVRCPSCRHYVERIDGCSSMACRCKTRFCYDCGEQACICKNWLYGWQIVILCIYFLVMSPFLVLAVVGSICWCIFVGTTKIIIRFGVLPPDHPLACAITGGEQQQETPPP
ncbi:hypothetical protein MKW94_027096 [Papaver nudicaule]|uniref:RBR-type E3 ubiquitin transferase n=1 Tax=Papaver nudicaule TaxID=74823 RepID=A0AA41S3L9_PAPNU|nr:hypothetical protein [Papaver nudicaule]